MSKGWYVKVETNVVFSVDTNVGVVASCEREAAQKAQQLVCDWIDRDDYKAELEKALPWELYLGGEQWNRGSQSGDIDFDTMQAVSVEPDTDFDPDGDPEPDHKTLMEVAQCLNEALHNVDCFHPLHEYHSLNGCAEVRDRINEISLACEMTYQAVRTMYGFDGPFDFDFCPQFLDNCVNDEFKLRSDDIGVLAILWERS